MMSPLGILQLRLNVALAVGYGLVALAILAPQQRVLQAYPSLFVTGVVSVIGWRIISLVQKIIDRFKPGSALDAKRLNEQLKSMSSALNTIATATVSVLAIAEIAKAPAQPNMLY